MIPEGSRNTRGCEAQDSFEALLRQALADGHTELADRLDQIMHHIAYTTGSELIGELGLAVREFERSKPTVSPELRQLLRDCKRVVRRVWPGLWVL